MRHALSRLRPRPIEQLRACSGVLNPELLKGQKGGRIWPKMGLKDRIDATITHEYEELRAGVKHAEAIRNAPKTDLPISDEARRLSRARAP